MPGVAASRRIDSKPHYSFDLALTKKFKDRMKEIFNKNGVLIFYANCEQLDAFRDDPAWTVYTNSTYHKKDLQWRELDIDLSYPVAVMELKKETTQEE